MKARLLLLVLSMVAMMGCNRVDSDKINQRDIKTTYHAQFDLGSETLTVTARFSSGRGNESKQVVLSRDSRVKLNGVELKRWGSRFDEVIYRAVLKVTPADINEAFQLVYTNNDRLNYINNFQFPALVEFEMNPTLSKKDKLEVRWRVTEPLQEYDAVFMVFQNESQNLRIFDRTPAKTEGIISLNPEQLRHLKEGRVPVYVGRLQMKADVQAPQAGGSLETETLSTRKYVDLYAN